MIPSCSLYQAVTIGFEQATYTVGESDVFLLYHVHIWGWLERAVTVNIAAIDGTATRELMILHAGGSVLTIGLMCTVFGSW